MVRFLFDTAFSVATPAATASGNSGAAAYTVILDPDPSRDGLSWRSQHNRTALVAFD